MTSQREVYLKNLATVKEYRTFLRMMPKVVMAFAVEAAISSAMEYDTANYTPAGGKTGKEPKTFVGGNKMPHDSSNAAFNWRISFNGAQAPLNDKGKEPVGEAFEKRSGTSSIARMEATIYTRLQMDVYTKLYSQFFSVVTAKAKNFIMYNSIDQLPNSSQYVTNSNVENAMTKAAAVANQGGKHGENFLLPYMNSGVGRMPNNKGLQAAVQLKFGG